MKRLRGINPKLVYCSISGFCADGPYAERPSYDSVAQALSGFLSVVVDPDLPRFLGPALADAIVAPDGSSTPVTAGAVREAPWTAGVHFWARGGERVGALVVNAEASESDLARLDADSLATRLGATTAGAARGRDFEIDVDRASAIRRLIDRARPGDTVLLAGKGHERRMLVRDERRPWNDREEAERALAAAGYGMGR